MSILPVVWAGIIAFCILMYVILDGFTLGTGILIPLLKTEDRDLAFSMLLPTWDGNQTWLVLGAASLYGAFPIAFGLILPLFYLPLLLMVISLLLRGVAFEFRLKSGESGKLFWDRCFFFGAFIATFIQGLILGAFIHGFDQPMAFPYHSFDWFSAYALFTGFALVFGYALLGATRLILKTEGHLQAKARQYASHLAWMVIGLAMIASLWTPFVDKAIFENWFVPSRIWLLVLMPSLTTIAWIGLISSLKRKSELWPYWFSIAIFICCYIGFGIGIWPTLVPHTLTIWQAASPPSSLAFMLVGALVMIPVLLVYTGYSYKIFSGKVKDVLHY